MTTPPLTISSLTLGDAPFETRVRAAASAGFKGIGLSVEAYLTARQSGLSDHTMIAILSQYGVVVTEVEFLSDWVPSPNTTPPSTKEATAFHVARTFGSDHINVGMFAPARPDLMADCFAKLCQRAGDLKIAVEYMPFGAIPDLGSAWELIQRAGQPNAGLVIDVWHWVRGATKPSELTPIPPDRVFVIQLCDVNHTALPDMRHESLHHRLVPGSRTDRAQQVLTILREHGVNGMLSAEVMSDALLATGFDATAKAVFAGTTSVIGEALSDSSSHAETAQVDSNEGSLDR